MATITRRELLEKRGDLSPFLIHLTRSGDLKLDKAIYSLHVRTAFDQLVITPLAGQFKTMMPLVEGFGPPWFPRPTGPAEIDFRWEREWRIAGDFSFTLSDVAFGFCHDSDIGQFETLVGAAFPFVDPLADTQTNKKKLREWAHLKDLN